MAVMSSTEALPKLASPSRETSLRALIAAVSITSFASLLLELALTRLFSVVLFYHFAFLAVSIALLGLGAGGVFAHIWRARLSRWNIREIGTVVSGLNAFAILFVLFTVLYVPVTLELERANFEHLTVIYLASSVPFFLTGLIFSVIFAREFRHTTELYGADLMGGAISCLAVVPLLNWVGGPNAIVFSALAMALAAVIWSTTNLQRGITILLALMFLTLLGANYSGKLIDIVYAKGYRRVGVLYARWNAISRVEVDQNPPTKNAGEDEIFHGKYIVIDADAATTIMHFDPRNPANVAAVNGAGRGSSVPSLLRPHGDFAIIGPGGGADVLTAVVNGSPNVVGIEINPLIANNIMRKEYADYAYHLYEIPQVHIHVGDGRSWIRSSRDHYDVLQMTLVDTWASTSAGAFALSENSLYTLEAFQEYFNHLKPDGLLAITRWEFQEPREALRVVSQAMEALRLTGAQDIAQHIIVIADGPLDARGQKVTVLAKKSPFTSEEQEAVRAYLVANPRLVLLYMPSTPQQNAFSQLIASGNARTFAASYAYNVSPVTDNAPFFFFTFKTDQVWKKWRTRTGSGNDWKNNLGVLVLGMVLIISIVAVMAFLILPLLLQGGSGPRGALPLAYFVAVGLGYITVEIALIQHFVLFLGHPTYALTVVVFLLLLSSGAGSIASRSWLHHPQRVQRALGAIIAAVILYVFVLPLLLPSLVGLPFAAKLLLTGLLLVPLGFLMGMPFPTGLRALTNSSASTDSAAEPAAIRKGVTVEWAWAMNAASSVLGSVLAIVLAVQFGLGLVLAFAAGAYLLAALLTFGWDLEGVRTA